MMGSLEHLGTNGDGGQRLQAVLQAYGGRRPVRSLADLRDRADLWAFERVANQIRENVRQYGSDHLALYAAVTQVRPEHRKEAQRIFDDFVARDRARFRATYPA